jgi:hypothetical protein
MNYAADYSMGKNVLVNGSNIAAGSRYAHVTYVEDKEEHESWRLSLRLID